MKKKTLLTVGAAVLGLAALVALLWVLPAVVRAVLGWTLLGLLGLIVLLLAAPLTIRLRLEGGELAVWVRVLFVRIKVLPVRPGQKKPEKPKKEKPEKKAEAAEGGEKEKKKRGFSQQVALIKRLARAGLKALGFVLRHLYIRRVELLLPVHAEDASDTAIRCGQLQTAIGTARAVLDGRLHMHYRRLEVLPDFTGQYKDRLFFACNIVFCPGILLGAGAVFLWDFLVKRRPYSKAQYKRALEEKRKAAQAAKSAPAA